MITKNMILKLINTPSDAKTRINEVDDKLKKLEALCTSTRSISKKKGD